MPHDLPRFWRRRTFTSYLLLPLSALFALITACRRALYRAGILRQYRAPVPVLIVGNISVGGNGKTPLVQELARAFQAEGIAVGIISRGYGGTAREATDVATCADAAVVGDEPLMLWSSTGAPVVVARKRAEAAEKLLRDYPATRLILADDGLQHYALARDAEVAVIAADFGLGNGWLMPAGPLRESAARLKRVDAVVHSGAGQGRAAWDADGPSRWLSHGATLLGVQAAVAALRRGLGWLETVRAYLWGTAGQVAHDLEQVPGLELTVPSGSYLAWLDCSGLEGAALEAAGSPARYLLGAGVAMNDGAAFGAGYERFCRLNLAMGRGVAAQATARIAQAVADLG